jgi:choline monooxygenase
VQLQLEDLHRGLPRGLPRRPLPPGLGGFVTTDDLRWQLESDYSVQTVGVSDKLGKPGTDTYKKWHDVVLQYRKGVPPKYGAIWLTYYPHVMVEWYPHVLVVSTLHPRGPDKTLNVVEFFYPEEICASSASSSRRSRPPTWKPAWKTTRSPCAWTPAARP